MNFWKYHLDWGWNPVIFFIVLAVSFVLVATVKRRVLWLVPALVMYMGLSWGLPYAWIFKTVFWVSLAVVLVTAFWSRRPTRFAKFPLAWMSALVAVILVLVGISEALDAVDGSGHHSSPSVSQTPLRPSETPSAAACKSTWPMAAQTPLNGNWVAQGVPSIKKAKTKAEAKAAAMDWLNKIKDMPGTLQGASAYLLNKQVSLSSLRGGDGCATAKAESLVNELSVALATSDISPSQAPTNGYNSGTKSGSTYTYSLAGVSGDRSAIRVKVIGKQVVWIMYRCGNAVTHRPPTPTKPHRPMPVCRANNCHPCPPGQWRNPKGICLQPKSTNPKDYTYPSGKPPVKAHGPAESRPPKVKTSQKGGGGVTDTPTNHPGSATGGKAPGTGSSTPRPTPTQPPATGSNDGSGGTIPNPF